VQDLEDEVEGYKVRQGRFEAEQKELEDSIKKNKEGIKEAEKLVKKYNDQQKMLRTTVNLTLLLKK